MSDKIIVLTGHDIDVVQFIARKAALKLEVLGLKRRGRSVYSIVKEEYGYTGSKQSVLEQMQADFDHFLKVRNAQAN